MMEAQKEAIEKILKTVTSAVGQTLNMMGILKFFIPVGFVAYAGYLFYKTFFVNPFKLSEDKLREHIAEARIEEEKYSKELEYIEKLVKRIEAGKIEADKSLLEIKKRQVEEAVNLAKTKILITEMVIMIRENEEVFNKLFGKDNFKKLLEIEKFSEHINKELKKLGLIEKKKKKEEGEEEERQKEINVELFYDYFKKTFPIILKHPEQFESRTEEQPPPQPPSPQPPTGKPPEEYVDQKILDEMLKEGSIDEWKGLIKQAMDTNKKIKILGRYEGKEGYRNLIITLYILLGEVKSIKLKEVIKDVALNRYIDYFKQLRSGTIEVDPNHSDVANIDQLIEIVCGSQKPLEEKSTETEIIKQYKLQLGEGELFIERKIQKDPITGRAQKIIYAIKR
jgi:hypothetical protein